MSLRYLYSLQRFGIKLGLRNIRSLLDAIDNPQKNFKSVIVGGTNGKGSTCAYLSKTLECAGYNVGSYYSPHVERFNERIIVNGNMISNENLRKLTKFILPYVKELRKKKINCTFFEGTTALAFQYFKKKNVDIAVVEVGLGGRMDATNILIPELSIITNVSLEHEDLLGETIEKIAYEKAGIIKKNVDVITACNGKALDVIKKVAKKKNAKLFVLGKEMRYRIKGEKIFDYFGYNKYENLKINLFGKHQFENASLAICAIERLNEKNFFINENAIREGLEKTFIPGRFELINNKFVLDAAHNVAAIEKLKEAIIQFTQNNKEPIKFIFGVLKDKNAKSMLRKIEPIAEEIIAVKPKTERARDPKELTKFCKNLIVIKEIKDAIRYASKSKGIVCITGSFYTIGEARKLLYLQSYKNKHLKGKEVSEEGELLLHRRVHKG
ncbi:MAG: folylpolyglutamate synthase/dihydrofolate synthase family protein [Candidatus Thermoplasmatota archaeon]